MRKSSPFRLSPGRSLNRGSSPSRAQNPNDVYVLLSVRSARQMIKFHDRILSVSVRIHDKFVPITSRTAICTSSQVDFQLVCLINLTNSGIEPIPSDFYIDLSLYSHDPNPKLVGVVQYKIIKKLNTSSPRKINYIANHQDFHILSPKMGKTVGTVMVTLCISNLHTLKISDPSISPREVSAINILNEEGEESLRIYREKMRQIQMQEQERIMREERERMMEEEKEEKANVQESQQQQENEEIDYDNENEEITEKSEQTPQNEQKLRSPRVRKRRVKERQLDISEDSVGSPKSPRSRDGSNSPSKHHHDADEVDFDWEKEAREIGYIPYEQGRDIWVRLAIQNGWVPPRPMETVEIDGEMTTVPKPFTFFNGDAVETEPVIEESSNADDLITFSSDDSPYVDPKKRIIDSFVSEVLKMKYQFHSYVIYSEAPENELPEDKLNISLRKAAKKSPPLVFDDDSSSSSDHSSFKNSDVILTPKNKNNMNYSPSISSQSPSISPVSSNSSNLMPEKKTTPRKKPPKPNSAQKPPKRIKKQPKKPFLSNGSIRVSENEKNFSSTLPSHSIIRKRRVPSEPPKTLPSKYSKRNEDDDILAQNYKIRMTPSFANMLNHSFFTNISILSSSSSSDDENNS